MSLLAVPRTDDSYEPAEFFVGSITSNFIQDVDYDKLIDFDSGVPAQILPRCQVVLDPSL
jgi:hypothetical protein